MDYDEIYLTKEKMVKKKPLNPSKVHNEENDLADHSYFTNFCLADMKETSKFLITMKELIDEFNSVEKLAASRH